MSIRKSIAGLAFLAAAQSTWALDFFTVDVVSDQLVRIDTATNQGVYVGALGRNVDDIDLTFHNGVLYGLSNSWLNVELHVIDHSTGAILSSLDVTNEVGAEVGMAEGLASDGFDLRMSFGYELGWSDHYGVINELTGQVMFSSSLPAMESLLGRADIDGMGFAPGIGMFGQNGEQAYTETFNVDLQTRIGVDFNQYVNDLVYMADTIYSIGGASEVEMRTYDPSTGLMLTTNPVTGLNFDARLVGLSPVPEPATFVALSAGLMALVGARRRR